MSLSNQSRAEYQDCQRNRQVQKLFPVTIQLNSAGVDRFRSLISDCGWMLSCFRCQDIAVTSDYSKLSTGFPRWNEIGVNEEVEVQKEFGQ